MSESQFDRVTVYRAHPDISFTRFGDEGLLVVPREAWQIVLNGVGARAFELLDGRRSLGQIADLVAEEYDVPVGQALADIAELLEDLQGKGAIQKQP